MRTALAVVLCLSATIAAGEVDLSTFVDVKTESFVSEDLGLSFSFPYDWVPASSPIENAAFSVRSRSSARSFTVVVREHSDIEDAALAVKELASVFAASSGDDVQTVATDEIQVDSRNAHRIIVDWTRPQGDRIRLRTTVVGVAVDDRLYLFVGMDSALVKTKLAFDSILESVRIES